MGFFDTLSILSITAGSLFLILGSLAIDLTSQHLVLPRHFKSLVLFNTVELLTVGGVSTIFALLDSYTPLVGLTLIGIGAILTAFLIAGLGTMAYSVYVLMNLIP